MNATADVSPAKSYVTTYVAVVCCAMVTLLLHKAFLGSPTLHRPAPQTIQERYPLLLAFNDTEDFRKHLEATAEGLKQGKLVFPISDYDCPVSFLLPMGALVAWGNYGIPEAMFLFALLANATAGVTAFGFIRALGAKPATALLAAIAYQSANYAHYFPYMGHLHCAQLQWMPLALWMALRVIQRGTLPSALAFGLVMGLQILSSPYYTLYLAYFALPAFAGVYWYKQPSPKPSFTKLILCGSVAVALALIVASVYLVPRLGTLPKTYPLDPDNGFHLTSIKSLIDPAHPVVFLGPAAGLGIIAVFAWRTNRTVAFSATLAAATVVGLMLLPGVVGSPYWAAYHTLPLLDRTRAPIRLAPLLNLLLLASAALWVSQTRWGTMVFAGLIGVGLWVQVW